MITSFSQITCEAIKYYVYLLIDPRDSSIFYIGKGINKRCFDHVKEEMESNRNTDKFDQIREIIKSNLEVRIKILRHGLNESESFLVESIAIGLIRDQLTNVVSGHDSSNFGMMFIEEVEQLYSAETLVKEDINHNLILININNQYEDAKGSIDDIY